MNRLLVAVALVASGCTLVGAGTGALIGTAAGNAGEGALIGAILGLRVDIELVHDARALQRALVFW